MGALNEMSYLDAHDALHAYLPLAFGRFAAICIESIFYFIITNAKIKSGLLVIALQ